MDTYLGIIFLLKNDRKHKFNETEDKIHVCRLYVSFKSIVREERLCSRCKYILTYNCNRLTP